MQYIYDQLPPVPYLTLVEMQFFWATAVLFLHTFFQVFTKVPPRPW